MQSSKKRRRTGELEDLKDSADMELRSKKLNIGCEDMWKEDDDDDFCLTPYDLEQFDRLESEAYIKCSNSNEKLSKVSYSKNVENNDASSSLQFLRPSVKNFSTDTISGKSDALTNDQTSNANESREKRSVNNRQHDIRNSQGSKDIITSLLTSKIVRQSPNDTKEFEKIRMERDKIKQECEKLKEGIDSKTGEIHILRENLNKVNGELIQLQQQIQLKDNVIIKEQSLKEKQLEIEIDKLQTQMKFKEREIIEIQNAYKQREEKQKNVDIPQNGIMSTTPLIKTKSMSPNLNKLNFVTKQTFLGNSLTGNKSNSTLNTLNDRPNSSKTNLTLRKFNLGSLQPQNTRGSHLICKILEPTGVEFSNSSLFTLLETLPSLNLNSLQTEGDNNSNTPDKRKSLKRLQAKLLSKFAVKIPPSKAHCLAIKGIASLLNQKNYAQIVNVPLSSLINLLPVIEETLGYYINTIQELLEVSSSSLESLSSKTPTISSVDSTLLSNSNRSDPNNANFISACLRMAQSALEVLCKLISYSSDVRIIIFQSEYCHNSKESRYDNKPETSCKQKKLENNMTVSKSEPCKILSILIQLATPRFFVGLLISDQSILLSALNSLNCLLSHASMEQLDGCLPLVSLYDTVLPSCLNIELGLDIIKQAFLLLSTLLKINNISKKLCNQTDDCFLLKLYKCCNHVIIKWPEHNDTKIICQEIINIVMWFVSIQMTRFNINLGSCDCVEEMLKCLFTIMKKELNNYYKCSSSNDGLILRKGITFLHQLHLHLNSLNELIHHQYVVVLGNLSKIYHKIKKLPEQELIVFQELWDVDSDDTEDH